MPESYRRVMDSKKTEGRGNREHEGTHHLEHVCLEL